MDTGRVHFFNTSGCFLRNGGNKLNRIDEVIILRLGLLDFLMNLRNLLSYDIRRLLNSAEGAERLLHMSALRECRLTRVNQRQLQLLDLRLQRPNNRRDRLRRSVRLQGQIAYFVRDHREAAAVHAGSGRFDRGIQRKHIRLR
ncbi:hypothetical protein D3C86_1518940 [compost metagenome]